MATVDSTKIEANLENFLKASLPPEGRSVLAVGDEHDDLYNVRFLADNTPLLTKQYNVGTATFENPLEMNVIYWAMQDGKLPPGADRHTYAQIVAMLTEDNPQKAPFMAQFQNQVIDSGGQLLAHDTRNAGKFIEMMNDDNSISKPFALLMRKSPEVLAQLRAGKLSFKDWSSQAIKEFSDLLDELPKPLTPEDRQEVISYVSQAEFLKVTWLANEIQTILDTNPEYASRLEKMMDYRRALLFVGKKEDDISAHMVSRFAAPQGNILTHGGYSHLSGQRNDEKFGQGLFSAHLERLGMKVTPVIFTGAKGIAKDGAYEDKVDGCASRAPLNIAVVDMDAVVGADKDSLRRTTNEAMDSGAKKVASYLLRRGIKLTCDEPSLPTSAQCAQQEAAGKGSCLPR